MDLMKIAFNFIWILKYLQIFLNKKFENLYFLEHYQSSMNRVFQLI